MFSKHLITMLILTIIAAQAQTIDFSGHTWKVNAQQAELEEFRGKSCLVLAQGNITLEDADFKNGVIEYDINFDEHRGFPGVQWRKVDGRNCESFYVRPHQSGNPDACQYTPVYNGISSWQLYHGEGHGAPINYAFGQWMHVKIVVNGKHGEIYYQDMTTPVVVIHDMKRDVVSGMLALTSGQTPVRYANFTFRKDDNITLRGEVKEAPPVPAGTILDWEVSNPFSVSLIADQLKLPSSLLKPLTWQKLDCEASGLLNVAELYPVSDSSDALFAKTTLRSRRSELRQLNIAYSDVAFVYLNGELQYVGGNQFRSRDYRYLGTIGYFDTVVLNLKKGENTLLIGLKENFGGWGVRAQLVTTEGVAVK